MYFKLVIEPLKFRLEMRLVWMFKKFIGEELGDWFMG